VANKKAPTMYADACASLERPSLQSLPNIKQKKEPNRNQA